MSGSFLVGQIDFKHEQGVSIFPENNEHTSKREVSRYQPAMIEHGSFAHQVYFVMSANHLFERTCHGLWVSKTLNRKRVWFLVFWGESLKTDNRGIVTSFENQHTGD